MEELFQYLSSLASLPAELKGALINRTMVESYRKNKPLLQQGQTSDSVWFIERGLVKTCYDVPGGDERIICFTKEGEMTCAVVSFTTDLPSKVSVMALTETTVRSIRKVELEALTERHSVFHVHLRKIIEQQTLLLEDHYLLYTLPPRDRYISLVKYGSWILKDERIRDYMIAAYLGVDRATLSRFRKKG